MALNRVSQVQNRVPIQTVLVSVSDKTGLEDFILGLKKINPQVQILSTGGTFAALEKRPELEGNLRQVSDYTGQPEMQGGLVKTLDFKIYLGLLSETFNPDHQQDLKRTGAQTIDMVVVNLYPFQKTVAQSGVTLEDARANIDIGGPTMLRASAKNFLRVASVCRPQDYPELLKKLQNQQGALTLEDRLALAKTTFAHTAAYDQGIQDYLNSQAPDLTQLYQFPGGF